MTSSARPGPFTLPEWRALHRESSLVSQILGAGLTSLGRASYGSNFGEYYTAFFGLSIGIERLCKLILVADHAAKNRGQLPMSGIIRKSGHDLDQLIKRVGEIAEERHIEIEYTDPSDVICASIVGCLNAFADASRGRYANFEAIGNPGFNPSDEPVNRWWSEVVEPILERHYRGGVTEAGVKRRAALIDAMMSGVTSVLHFDESGGIMTDVATASERTGQTEVAQKYGRYYTASIIRWLSVIFSEMSQDASYRAGTDCLFGHYEFFSSYVLPDKFLLKRKIWPLK